MCSPFDSPFRLSFSLILWLNLVFQIAVQLRAEEDGTETIANLQVRTMLLNNEPFSTFLTNSHDL